ncbi:MAG: hypothetical protein RR426_08920 [Oscillospiraceae bacterium]
MLHEWSSETVTRIHLRRKVSVAVLVIDDFTGRPVTCADLSVSAEQMLGKPVRKGDGYFLFLDCPVPALDITAQAWAYHPGRVRVEPEKLSPLRPVIKLRLTPNRNYSIPNQTTCLEGCALPGTLLRVFCENDPRPLRLLYDYAKKGDAAGCLLQLYDPTASDQEGRQFALLRKGETEPECFEVRETGEEGDCLLTAPLARDCKKAGTTVLPISTAIADGEGRFFLPLRSLPVKSYQCRILWTAPDGTRGQQALELEPGRVTTLDLCKKNP